MYGAVVQSNCRKMAHMYQNGKYANGRWSRCMMGFLNELTSANNKILNICTFKKIMHCFLSILKLITSLKYNIISFACNQRHKSISKIKQLIISYQSFIITMLMGHIKFIPWKTLSQDLFSSGHILLFIYYFKKIMRF